MCKMYFDSRKVMCDGGLGGVQKIVSLGGE